MALPDIIAVEDLFGSPERAGASISSDGTRIAYLAPWKNRLNVWVQDLDTDTDAVRHRRRDPQRDPLRVGRRSTLPDLQPGRRR
jgi:hypothetical protein